MEKAKKDAFALLAKAKAFEIQAATFTDKAAALRDQVENDTEVTKPSPSPRRILREFDAAAQDYAIEGDLGAAAAAAESHKAYIKARTKLEKRIAYLESRAPNYT